MTSGPLTTFLRRLRRLTARQGIDHLTDPQLLQRFTAQHDEAAFAALMHRHGPLVVGVGRRILHDQHAAEDVFQATFLVLARKAASIRKREALAGWLYRVAYRLAVNVKAEAAARGSRERRKPNALAPDPLAEVTWRELGGVLDEELQRLPERFRSPLVLVYLEDQTQDEAARQLGWAKSTFRLRLEQGRELLRNRLLRRGVTLSTGLLATALAQGAASAMVSAALVDSVLDAALSFGLGELLTTPAAVLAEGD